MRQRVVLLEWLVWLLRVFEIPVLVRLLLASGVALVQPTDGLQRWLVYEVENTINLAESLALGEERDFFQHLFLLPRIRLVALTRLDNRLLEQVVSLLLQDTALLDYTGESLVVRFRGESEVTRLSVGQIVRLGRVFLGLAGTQAMRVLFIA